MSRKPRDARFNPAREKPRPADSFGGPLVRRYEGRGRYGRLCEVWENAVYSVCVPCAPAGMHTDTFFQQASIDRLDGNPLMDWRHMQRIKNAVFGEDAEAVEVFPAESRLVDTSNTRHLWRIPPAVAFGFQGRMVVDSALPGGRLPQRAFPEGAVPERLDDPAEIASRYTTNLTLRRGA